MNKLDAMYIIINMLIGGSIGLFTNWLAIKMLFRPYKEKYIMGMKLPFTPGMVPKEKGRIGKSISEAIDSHIITKDMLINSLLSDELLKEIECIIQNNFEEFSTSEASLNEYLSKYMVDEEKEKLIEKVKRIITKEIMDSLPNTGLIGMFVGGFEPMVKDIATKKTDKIINMTIGELIGKIQANEKDMIKNVLIYNYKEVISKEADKIVEAINIKQIIEKKIDEFSVEELEKIILGISSKELQAITWLGGVLGIIIALIGTLIR